MLVTKTNYFLVIIIYCDYTSYQSIIFNLAIKERQTEHIRSTS